MDIKLHAFENKVLKKIIFGHGKDGIGYVGNFACGGYHTKGTSLNERVI
jgi:hypothetical protein